ncbi:invasion associated locus B family protein [Histidinibacterium aquaticum]|uniref:Invasion associated locus B family protein n=1 Tax=Histidinibacterium aquaticum TaxID=2613962 RepID=A0A5J5GAX9_9RHOB|nr:invasion associated locus B family protein [Histidinibacterium aquaticum]KAA9005063.1 hypothetical protein F3S47_18720 [Histidinibacterium aquaticum]
MRHLAKAFFSALLLQMAGMAFAQGEDGPAPVSREEVGDWAIECFDEAETECQLYQRVLTQDPLVVAMVVTFYPIADGAFNAQIALPLGVDLSQRPELRLDAEPGIPLAWSRCIALGCLVEGSFNAGLMARIQDADQVVLAVFNPNGGELTIPLYMEGFEEAVSRLSTAEPALEPEAEAEPAPEIAPESE